MKWLTGSTFSLVVVHQSDPRVNWKPDCCKQWVMTEIEMSSVQPELVSKPAVSSTRAREGCILTTYDKYSAHPAVRSFRPNTTTGVDI
jgi:hypothetical protein